MSAPTNTSAGTAQVIMTAPYTATQTVDDAGTTYTVWYTFTTDADDVAIALHGYGDFSTYTPTTTVYSDAGTTVYRALSAIAGKNVYFDVTGGQQYWFKFTTNGGNPSPAVLHVKLFRFTEQTTTAGDLLICDDEANFPGSILSQTDGTVLRYLLDFPNTDYGEMLPTNVSLWRDGLTDVVRYGPALTPVGTITLPFSIAAQFGPISSNRTTTFYCGRGGTNSGDLAEVTTVSSVGVLGSTVWTLGQHHVICLCPSLDDTILYYCKELTGIIYRWDLVNDVTLTNLATFNAGTTSVTDLKMLADGTLLVGYTTAIGADAFVKRYDSGGTLLNTYDVGNSGDFGFDKMSQSLEDPDSFWVWKFQQTPSGFSRFELLQTSDGSVLRTFDQPFYNPSGVYAPTATATPDSYFGNSESCPLVIIYGSVTPSPTFTTDIIIPRRQRRAPHLSREQLWNFYSQFQLDLETGVGLTSGYGSDPQIMLRWSDDGGHTWSTEHWVSAGARGKYATRAIWRRLGRSRDRVFEVTVSDPVAWNLLQAFIQADPGTS